MIEQRIFITGGAGFIGRRLIGSLLAQNPSARIWVYDNLHPQVHGDSPAWPELPQNVTFVYGDVVDAAALQKAMMAAQPQLIYHLAAETGTSQSYDEPARYCAVNIQGTANLIEAIRKVATVTRVVLAASRAVYGEGAYKDADGRLHNGLPRHPDAMQRGDFAVPVDHDAVLPLMPALTSSALPPMPVSIYASTKLMQEYLLTQASENSGWDVVCLRFQNVYGPGQSMKNPYTGVLSIFARQLMDGKVLDIFEDGEIVRDFVFVDDVARALTMAGAMQAPSGTIIDIGSGVPTTMVDVARLLMRALGRGEDSYRITGNFRVGDIRYACADISRAKNILGWQPQVTIAQGLSLLASWAMTEDQKAGDDGEQSDTDFRRDRPLAAARG